MKSLEVLDICGNNINSFTVAGESTNIKRISFFENRLRSFKGGGTFTKLKSLQLGFNQLSDDFVITREYFPTSIKHLDLSGNGLTGVRGLEVLTNLQNLQLCGNKLEGDVIVNKENFPTSIKMLSLRRNQLTGFVGGAILTSLEKLWIDNNELSGDLMITAENFPTSIETIWLYGNKLTSIDVEPGFDSNLESLILSFQDNAGIMAKDELCKSHPELIISPSDACSIGRIPPAYLESIIVSVIEENDFSSYNQDDFYTAKSWFLNPSNHLIDIEIGDEYMKERFVLALIYSANCKEGCTLSNWLSGKDHCKWWQGIECNSSRNIYEISCIGGCRLSGEFNLFGMKSLETLTLSVPFYVPESNPSLSGTFTVAGTCENLRDLFLTNNKLAGFVGGKMLINLETLWLGSNEFEGEFIINEENFPTSIKTLDLSGNMLTDFLGGGILTNLETLRLQDNEFVGDLMVDEENFPISIKKLYLYNNRLTGFFGGKILKNLEQLNLNDNEFVGDFIVNKENFPTSIKWLIVDNNKLTSFVGGGILTSLEKLWIDNNEISDALVIRAENFSTSIKEIWLFGNKLTSFEGGGILINLETLLLQDNELNGDLMIIAENFPPSVKEMNLSDNKLTSVDAEPGAVINLSELYVAGNWGTVTIGDELCSHRPDLSISSSASKVIHAMYNFHFLQN